MDQPRQRPKRGTWDQLKLGPWELSRMVIQGRARIVGKDKYRRNIYELTELKNGRDDSPETLRTA